MELIKRGAGAIVQCTFCQQFAQGTVTVFEARKKMGHLLRDRRDLFDKLLRVIIEFHVGQELARRAFPLAKPGNNPLDLLQGPVHHRQGVIRVSRHTGDVSFAAARQDRSYWQQRLPRIAG